MRAALPLAAVGALLLSGCLATEERVVLEPDGSGSASVRITFDPGALRAALDAVRAHLGLPTAAPATEGAAGEVQPADPEWLRAQARGVEGVTLRSVTLRAGPDGRRVTEAESLFGTLEDAARGGLFGSAEVAFERRPKGRWRFTLRDAWATSGPGAVDALGAFDTAPLLGAFGTHLAHARHELTLTFPHAVLSTNGSLSEDRRTVRWSARGDDAAPRILEVELELSDEVTWPTFRHRPDLGALTRRCLLPPPAPPAVVRED